MANVWYTSERTESLLRAIPVKVVKVNHKASHAVRDAFTRDNRIAFLKQLRRTHEVPFDYQIHHIVPISLGGNNNYNNLVAIDRVLHEIVHEMINEQIRGMNIGDKRIVKIPIVKAKVWHRNTLSL